MKKSFLLLVLFTAALSWGQCTLDIKTGGTDCNGPLTVVPPPGSNPTTVFEFTPATSAFSCPQGMAARTGKAEMCFQNGAITVDIGQGYKSLKGDQGAQGTSGVQGPKGDKGSQGIPGLKGDKGDTVVGPAWSPAGKTFTISCAGLTAAKGGTGVPKFSVQSPILVGCSIQ